MSCSPHHETLNTLKSVLYRTFFVGLAFTIMFGAIMVFGWNTWLPMLQQWFPAATPAMLTAIILDFFTTIRFYLVFVLLTPALGIQWYMCAHNKHHHDHHPHHPLD